MYEFPADDLTVIVLTNTDEQIATTLANKIATLYFAAPAPASASQ